ncbi:kinase-like protein [Dendrothele bispora CBS 962.96]|uniref:Kinase-like protein n=1 Tax=Dendrothele bispora (strain CBS 962.96) TaxID=1314807 RepID=A0A4S8MQ18_DENBC|nr:kinase-like protein [Dendrothele bispora CBS 962.96]
MDNAALEEQHENEPRHDSEIEEVPGNDAYNLSLEDAQKNIDALDIFLSREAQYAIRSIQDGRSRDHFFIDSYRRSLRRLRNLCERYELLPSWCLLSTNNYPQLESQHPAGYGGYADVFRGVLTLGPHRSRTIALKRLRVHVYEDRHRVRQLFMREASVWSQLRHPNILPFIAVYVNLPHELSIASPWMQNGDIISYISSHASADVQRLALNVVDGLAFMHSIGVVHGDLKSSNVLVDEWHNACLSDFGLSTFHHTNTMTPRIDSIISAGSLRWSAPEQLLSGGVEPNRAVDVYAFGVLLWELITCRMPYDHIHNDALVLHKVPNGMRPCRLCILEASGSMTLPVKQSLYDLMSECWSPDSSFRPKMEDPFLRSRLVESAVGGIPITTEILSPKMRVLLIVQSSFGIISIVTLAHIRKQNLGVSPFSTLTGLLFLVSLTRYAFSPRIKLVSFRITLWTDIHYFLQVTVRLFTILNVYAVIVSTLFLCADIFTLVFFRSQVESEGTTWMNNLLLSVCMQLFLTWYPDIGFLVNEISRRWRRWRIQVQIDSQQGFNRRLYVTKLPDSATTETMRELFNTAGKIDWINLHRDSTGTGLNHVVLEYKTNEDGETALRTFHEYEMEGKRIQVSKCQAINWGVGGR